jgi:hypothetical protein
MPERKLTRGAFLFVVVVLGLVMAGCEQTTINQIKADPGRYANKEVTIAGEVVNSYSVIGTGGYELDDGTGKLLIIAKSGAPRKGAKVVVKGNIKDGYDMGALIKVLPDIFKSGLVMIESSHKAR